MFSFLAKLCRHLSLLLRIQLFINDNKKNHNIHSYYNMNQRPTLPNYIIFLFFISRSTLISSTASCFVKFNKGVPVTVLTNKLICFYWRSVEGIVQISFPSEYWASRVARSVEIYWFYFSTWAAHLRFAKVY